MLQEWKNWLKSGVTQDNSSFHLFHTAQIGQFFFKDVIFEQIVKVYILV